ncbi:hypothetical protein SAMN05216529_10782 [Faecalicatena contorta]|jgi:hypothetical protein|uniref:Uncharacterized protein n=1 Tax=Faecalicatena contorta TaxID=39482 RepID=A0A315ZXY5_9FIRM|nr:hypothetical protein A8805_10782 [Faecalicatena contorta]SUQ14628.1 hypothetical protein SAMN05216529_10782 [Faecalicatena contorta]
MRCNTICSKEMFMLEPNVLAGGNKYEDEGSSKNNSESN